MRVGITGHQRLENPTQWRWVRSQLELRLSAFKEELVGVTSLAEGADQIFAESVLSQGGSLWVVVPFPGYEQRFGSTQSASAYQMLLEKAAKIETLEGGRTDQEGYLSAGLRVVDLVVVLFAVWDGHPARGHGGTADVVKLALSKNRTVVHINPVLEQTSTLAGVMP